MKTSISEQDYLQTIYRLQQERAPVSTTALATQLRVAPASVTGMIQKLHRQGLVAHVPYQGVVLTDAGEREALRMIRRHRLWELFLTEVLGLPWDEVHAEAHRLEHATSDRVMDRLAAYLNEPESDPHGQRIPPADDLLPGWHQPPGLSLLDVPAGQAARIVEVPDGDPVLLRELGELGLIPGAEVTSGGVSGDDVLLRRREGGECRLARSLARRIRVLHSAGGDRRAPSI